MTTRRTFLKAAACLTLAAAAPIAFADQTSPARLPFGRLVLIESVPPRVVLGTRVPRAGFDVTRVTGAVGRIVPHWFGPCPPGQYVLTGASGEVRGDAVEMIYTLERADTMQVFCVDVETVCAKRGLDLDAEIERQARALRLDRLVGRVCKVHRLFA